MRLGTGDHKKLVLCEISKPIVYQLTQHTSVRALPNVQVLHIADGVVYAGIVTPAPRFIRAIYCDLSYTTGVLPFPANAMFVQV